MTSMRHPVDRALEVILLALQLLQVVFLWIHDWIPLGRLNDVGAVRSQDTLRRLNPRGPVREGSYKLT
jgi:hypothetical protein